MPAAGQHLVQDADRAHVARTHPEQRVPGPLPGLAGFHGDFRVPVTRSADHNLARGGCSTFFHDCGPAECPNAAVSDRSRSRYLPASVSTPQPNGSSAAEASSATTIAPSRTVGPTTV